MAHLIHVKMRNSYSHHPYTVSYDLLILLRLDCKNQNLKHVSVSIIQNMHTLIGLFFIL